MITFKGFDIGLKCRGYQFSPYVENVCERADAHQRGFHSAQNPLDVLTYYPTPSRSEYWVCEAYGDMDEDGDDSKVSSTVLVPRMRIDLRELLRFGVLYLNKHPEEWRRHHERVEAYSGYAVAVGTRPIAKGRKGSILAFYSTAQNKYNVFTVGDGGTKPDTWYDMNMREVSPNERAVKG